MKTLLSPMVGVAVASFMLSAHADFIDDSHADVTLLNRYLNQQGRDVVNSNAKAHSIRDWGQGFEFSRGRAAGGETDDEGPRPRGRGPSFVRDQWWWPPGPCGAPTGAGCIAACPPARCGRTKSAAPSALPLLRCGAWASTAC